MIPNCHEKTPHPTTVADAGGPVQAKVVRVLLVAELTLRIAPTRNKAIFDAVWVIVVSQAPACPDVTGGVVQPVVTATLCTSRDTVRQGPGCVGGDTGHPSAFAGRILGKILPGPRLAEAPIAPMSNRLRVTSRIFF